MDNQQQQQQPPPQYYYAHQDKMDPDDPYSPSTQSVGVIYPPMMQHPTPIPQQPLPSAEEHQQQQHHPESIPSHSQYVNVDDPMAHSGFADNHNMPALQQNRFAHHHPLPLSHHNQPFVGIEEYQQAAQQHQHHQQQQHPHLQHPQPPPPPPPPHHIPVYAQRIGVPPTPIAVTIPTSNPVSVVHTPIVPSSTPIHHHHQQQAYTPITPHPQSASPPPISPEPPSPHHSQHSSISSELASYNNNPFHPGGPGAIVGGTGHQTPNTTPSSGAPSPSPSLSSSRSSHHGGGGHGPPSSLVHRSSSHTGVHRYHPTGSSPSPTQSQASSSGWGPGAAGPQGHNRTRSLSYQESPSSLQHYTRAQQQQQQEQQDPDSDQELIDAAEESHISSPPPQPPMLAHAYSVMPMHVPSHSSHSHHGNDSGRKEATRRQRIEAEQRRRDELREGYARLKDVLPVTNMKSSKVSLLERAVNHILHLTKMNETLQTRLAAQETEISRLRMINERIALSDTPPLGSLQPPPPGQSHEEETEVERAVSATTGEGDGVGDEDKPPPPVKEEYEDSLISSAAGFDP